MNKLCEKVYSERVGEFKTKNFRSSYNDALLRADIKQELKDVMMGHKRESARGHYHVSETTIKEAYAKAFRYLSINSGMQAKADLFAIRQSLVGQAQTITEMQKKIDTLGKALEREEFSRRIREQVVPLIIEIEDARELVEHEAEKRGMEPKELLKKHLMKAKEKEK